MTKDTSKTVISTIQENLRRLHEAPEEDMDIIKEIVCPFFKEGKNPWCKGCKQPIEYLVSCRKDYMTRIEARPMLTWEKEFSRLEVRERKPISALSAEIGLSCSRCHLSDNCPYYEPMSTCAIEWGEGFNTGDTKEMLNKLIEIQGQRINRAFQIEQMDGGVPDQTLSGEIDKLKGLISTRNDLDREKLDISIHGSRPAQGGQQGGSLLASIFGAAPPPTAIPNAEQQKSLDAPFEILPAEVPETKKSGRK